MAIWPAIDPDRLLADIGSQFAQTLKPQPESATGEYRREIPQPDTPPERIKVYTTPPTYDAKGTLVQEGTLFKFDPGVQARVLSHTARSRNREAL